MSTISELHNPVLNSGFLGRLYANGLSVREFDVDKPEREEARGTT